MKYPANELINTNKNINVVKNPPLYFSLTKPMTVKNKVKTIIQIMCIPIPARTDSIKECLGYLNTSLYIYFHPESSVIISVFET